MTPGEIRSLAVEIVDAIHGHTVEFSNAPNSHNLDYDQIEGIITRRVRQAAVNEAERSFTDACDRLDPDLSGCPYYRAYLAGMRRAPSSADLCSRGCGADPACVTLRPAGGWPSERHEAAVEAVS